MAAWSISAWAAAALAVLAVSALVTWWSIAYATRRDLLDHPGRRRSHASPTPRGGGIGIVAGVLLGNAIAGGWFASGTDWMSVLLSASLLIVAGVGWMDDHRGLGVRTRLLAHGVAAFVVLGWVPVALILRYPVDDALNIVGYAALAPIFLVLIITWSINLHNFMDGIDGLLTTQALFVFIALSWLFFAAGKTPEAGRIGLFAAALLGFLPFNFPRARVFMGDVGSGALGLLVAFAVIWSVPGFPGAMASGLIACSAFVVDATATLLSRILRGRRWYSAHREHLYQWLVRSGRSHAHVVALYAGWNLLVVTPVLWWINRMPDAAAVPAPAQDFFVESGFRTLLAVYALAALVWILGKRYCLKHASRRARGLRAQ